MKSIAAVAALIASIRAAPTGQSMITGQSNQDLPFFYPETELETFSPQPGYNLLPISDSEFSRIALEKLSEKLGVDVSELQISSFSKDKAGVAHVYINQVVNGVKVENHNAAIHITASGEVLAQSSSFSRKTEARLEKPVEPSQLTVSLADAEAIASKKFGIPRDDQPATTAYLQTKGGKLALVHKFQLRDDEQLKWFEVMVDAVTGEVLSATNYYNFATYRVLELPKVNPLESFENVVDPETANASPKGWASGTQTSGNNVDSHIGSYRTDGGSAKKFLPVWNAAEEPTSQSNKDAAIVNNFYLSNRLHDIVYEYGFDEASGNFQIDNNGKGGAGSDAVNINNQASGTNNANFATPPDGQQPTMNMYLWTLTTPKRDGSLDSAVPLHEYTHGISNRLTGGPSAASCLRSTESGGMGEGWSDTMAFLLTMKETDTNTKKFGLGSYVLNNEKGIRAYPYSTDRSVNPSTYGSIAPMTRVHDIGAVWGQILWDVYWTLVDAKGFTPNWLNANAGKGNTIMMMNMIGGMKLQPCNPTFIQARDAILAADVANYGGANKCLMWKGFASRGLGVDAANKKDGFKVPAECSGSTTPTPSVPSPTPTGDVPVPTTPAPVPVVASITFPASGNPTVTGTLVPSKPVKLSYDTSRMSKVCEQLEVCTKFGWFGRYNCQLFDSSKSNDLPIVFDRTGSVYLKFESKGPSGSCAVDTQGSMGYPFTITAA